jgi:Ca-activated chloride channel family protein
MSVFMTTVLVLATMALAQEARVLPPPPPPPPMPHPVIQRDLTLTDMKVSIEIRGAVAHTTLRQTLRNDGQFVAEGQYMMPLPPGASVSDFAILDGDKRLTPKVLSREEARRVYQEIVRKMRDPGLLEYQDASSFSVNVFPFQPGQSRSIEVSLTQALSGTTDLVSYNLPLRWAGWSRCGEGGRGTSFVLSYSIDSDYDLGSISSPTFGLSVNRDGARKASGSYEASLSNFTNDFALSIGRRTGEFAASLMCFPGEDGEDGYFLLGLLAALPRDQKYVPKDFLLIFDKSGSMAGEKIEQTKGALRFILGKLKGEDRFGMIYYCDTVSRVFDGLREASGANTGQARSVLDTLDADGGTDIMTALMTGAEMLRPNARPAYALFLTDGLPTVGDTDVNNIIAMAKERIAPEVKLFVFGAGYDVNTTLLDSLSYNHHGSATYVSPGEDIEVKVSQFYAKMSSPALVGLTVRLEGLDTFDLMPKDAPDLFHNNEVFIAGRYRGHPAGSIKISAAGKTDMGAKTLSSTVAGNASAANHQVPRLWATRKVSYLLDQIRLHGDNAELIGEIDRLATRYGIVTPYTSYLITEPDKYFDRDLRMSNLGANIVGAREEESGQAAVGRSKMSQANQASGVAAAPQVAGAAAGEYDDQAYVKYTPSWFGYYTDEKKDELRRQGSANLGNYISYVNDQTFILQEAPNQQVQWVDARYDKDHQHAIRVTTYGDSYFKLLDEFPVLADYLSQGENVMVTVSDSLVLETTTDDVQNTTSELDELRGALRKGGYLSWARSDDERRERAERETRALALHRAGGGPPQGWALALLVGLAAALAVGALTLWSQRSDHPANARNEP